MKTWMRSVLEFVGLFDSPRRETTTRARKAPSKRISAIETLERREVMSGAGVPIATLSSAVTAKGDVAHVVVHFDAGQLASDRSQSILMGFYAKPTTGSSLAPSITEVDGASGRLSRVGIPQRGSAANSKALFIASVPLGTGQAQNLTVDVTGLDTKTGAFDLEVFLPGDVNGDSVVNATDLTMIQGAYGTAAGQANFNGAADFNADGHVGCVDRFLADLNQGAHAVYAPFTTPAASVAPAVTPAVAPTVTPPAAAPAPTVTTTPVVTTQTVTTPVVTTQAVTTTPVVVAPVQASPTVTAVPTAPVVVTSVQSAPVATPVYSPGNGAAPVYLIPATQQATAVQVSPGSAQASAAAPLYYSGQVANPTQGTVSLTNQAPMPGVAYYIGQPVVQSPGYSQTISNQTTSNPVASPGIVYYGQPVVQAPGYTSAVTPNVVYYYYGQPATQVTTTSRTV